ncbi:MAG: CAP domain-containing protein [Chloroflexi bacterium]|nr:CAP domain-containing protein [Chloroflexota bacterium]
MRIPVFAPRAAALGVALAAAISMAIPAGASSGADCQFSMGFKALHDAATADVGDCLTNQAYAANGDAQQPTTKGMLVWRKSDNFTAFTDGYHTWVNGPSGVQERLNSDRFSWEAATPASATVAPALLGGVASPAPVGQNAQLDVMGTKFFNELNTDRLAQGLSPLVLNSQLSGLAVTRAQGLVPKGGALSHYDASGNLVLREIMDDNHIPYITAGENLAENNFDAAQTVDVANTGLMNSPTHRANILNGKYTQVGIGLAGPDSDGRFYYVQLFLQS